MNTKNIKTPKHLFIFHVFSKRKFKKFFLNFKLNDIEL